jgi:hypothetical protein
MTASGLRTKPQLRTAVELEGESEKVGVEDAASVQVLPCFTSG